MKHIFREYDIRGIFGREITPKFAKALGLELGKLMLKKDAKSVSVGMDVRLSNHILHNALIYGLNQTAIKVYSIGIVPTPLGYFSNYACDIDANIIISASHNPKEYNGFKITINKESFFAHELASIADNVLANCDKFSDEIETTEYEHIDIVSKYVDFIEREFAHLKGADVAIAIDTASGAACEVAARVLDALKIKYAHFNERFDGEFRAHEPDPTDEANLEALKAELGFDGVCAHQKPHYKNDYKANSAVLGFGFDGDADRVVCLCKDKIIKGDELCYLFAKNMPDSRFLCEVKCSKVIFDEINRFSTCVMGKTGHSNIKKAIKDQHIDLAAELSGHVFFNDHYYGYDDAIYAMLRVIELYLKGVDFKAELAALPLAYSSDELKVPVAESEKFAIIERFKALVIKRCLNAKLIDIDGVRLEFEDGFLLLRASNTSPYLISRFEANSQERLEQIAALCDELLQFAMN